MTLPKNVDDIYPLTPMQRLMLLHAISPAAGDGLVNQVCYHIRGALDAPAFHRAWDAVVARHPALRTAFLYEGLPQPLQAVRSAVTLPFQSVDLSGTPPDERVKTLGALRRDDADAPMPLGKAPLMRCTLARLGPEHHYFIWTVHHLIVDRWSHAILFAELRTLYGAYTRGEDPTLGTPPPFRDYVEWTTRQDEAAAERFWREELADVREPTLLAGAATSARQCRSTTRHVLAIDVTARAREHAARFKVTVAALLSSAVGVVIANRTGRRDVIYGITVSGRPPELPDADAMVGSLVNNLPARLTLHPHGPIAEWVRDVQRAQMRREVHGHVSLTAIQGWSEIPPARPLFDTLVLLNLTGGPDLVWPGIELVLDTATLDAAFPLLLSATMEGGRLALTLTHDDTFDAPAQLLADLEATIVRMTAADAAAPLAELLQPDCSRSPNVATADTQPSELHAPSRGRQTTGGTTADALLQAWRDVLGIEELGLDDDFFAIGGTSLQAAQLFVRVERITGRTLPLSTLVGAGSVRALLAAIDHRVPRSGTVVSMRSSGTEPPLYAVPGIGGNVVGLAGLARAVGPDQPFLALESPGLDGREPPLTSIEAIAERYAHDIVSQERRPFHLLGLCWGAAVAAEMTRKLAALGRTPISLALVDPAVLLRETSTGAAPDKAGFLRSRLELYWDEFREGNWADRTRLLANKARRAARILASGEERRQSQGEVNQFRVMEANRDAVIRYIPAPVEARARIFITRYHGDDTDPRLEWLSLVEPRPDIVPIPGVDSGDAIAPANVGQFAAVLQPWLREAGTDSSLTR